MSKDTDIRRELYTHGSQLRLREDGGDSGRTIEGYAILFDTPSLPLYSDGEDEVREEIAPEAVTRELLDGSDIKFTMFHDNHLLLARSKQGKGSLSYEIGMTELQEAPPKDLRAYIAQMRQKASGVRLKPSGNNLLVTDKKITYN